MSDTCDRPTPMRGRPQPGRADVVDNPRLTLVDNSLASLLLRDVRDARTATQEFGARSRELAKLLIWEACRDIPLALDTVPGFEGTRLPAHKPAERLAGVVVLRAGMLFATPFRDLFRTEPLYQIGVRRNEATLAAAVYANNLPVEDDWADRVLIFDPMLATGGTVAHTIRLARQHHRGPIDVLALIAAPLGVQTVLAVDTRCRVVALALDEALDERGFIVPGLGDAGDRLFGTV